MKKKLDYDLLMWDLKMKVIDLCVALSIVAVGAIVIIMVRLAL